MNRRTWLIGAGVIPLAALVWLLLRPSPPAQPEKSPVLARAEDALRRSGCFAAVVVDSAAAWDSGAGGSLVARCEAPESVAPTCATLARALVDVGAPNGKNFATMVTGGGSVQCYVLYDPNGAPIGDFLALTKDAGGD